MRGLYPESNEEAKALEDDKLIDVLCWAHFDSFYDLPEAIRSKGICRQEILRRLNSAAGHEGKPVVTGGE